MLLKPGKPPEQVSSYRPIALLPCMSKLFGKLLLKYLNPIIEAKQLIPDHQFGFRIKHSFIDQLHRVTNVISKALEEKNYCCGVFLDAAQTFGPILYLYYTTDIPTNDNTMIAMFADDTAILSTKKDQQAATKILQTTINTVYNWTKRWKIKINRDKSVHVNHTLCKTTYIPITLNHQIIPRNIWECILTHDLAGNIIDRARKRLELHTNTAAIQLLDNSPDIRRLK
ncbi:Reverse transcriptase domain [Cinara cedri]|uniref:Reverse transcriptase domain n=1 Tax=Cinara cedri TaxID=506608 RepID=A0A5E4NGJ7_9HEMI|nr:Reverse transcriptase domain [Cinara cedri]